MKIKSYLWFLKLFFDMGQNYGLIFIYKNWGKYSFGIFGVVLIFCKKILVKNL
jgi:hypothetical protein